MNIKIVEQIFPGTEEAINNNLCPHCKKSIGKFRDGLSVDEYRISGLCQKCQDSVFGKG